MDAIAYFLMGFCFAWGLFVTVAILRERAARRQFMQEIDELLRKRDGQASPNRPFEQEEIEALISQAARRLHRPGVRH